MIANPWQQILFQAALWIKNPWGLSVEEQRESTLNISHSTGSAEGELTTIDYDFSAIEYDRSKVRAFPQFTHGVKDVALAIPDNYTPRPLDKGLNVLQFMSQAYLLSFNTQSKVNPNAQCNIASEVFLYPASFSGPVVGQTPSAHEYEIMLWVDSPKDESISLGEVVRADEESGYKVYAKPGNKRYMAIVMDAEFVNTDAVTNVNIQWSKALSLARAIASVTPSHFDAISDTWKVFGIETGVEIWGGSGEVFFENVKLSQVRTNDNKFITDYTPEEQAMPVGGDGPVLPTDIGIQSPRLRHQAFMSLYMALESIENNQQGCRASRSEEREFLTIDMPEHTILLTEKIRLITSLSQLLELERRRLSNIVGYVASQQANLEDISNE